MTHVTGPDIKNELRLKDEVHCRETLPSWNSNLEHSPVIVTKWDRDFVLQYWSPQAEIAFGWKSEDIVGKRFDQFVFVHEEDRKAFSDADSIRGWESKSGSKCCVRNYDKDGLLHYCEWYHSPLLNAKGELESVFSIALDATDRVQAEQCLRARESSMRLVFQAAHVWFWEIDPQLGVIRYSENTGIPGFTGGAPVLTMEDWFACVHADDRERVREAISATWIQGHEYDIKFRVYDSDNSIRWIYSRGSVFRDDGQQGRFLGVAIDITRHKRTEADLKDSRDRLRMAAEAARLCAWDWDVRRGQLFWSGDARSIYGCDAEQLSGVDQLYSMIHPEDREHVRSEVAHEISSRSTDHRIEYRVIWPDGSHHAVLAFGRMVFDKTGHAMRIRGVSMDITERKRSEEALRLNDRLVATGRMAAALAHEINNPLASVTNLLYLLELQPLDFTSREYVKMATAEVARVSNITRDILGLYRESPTAISVEISELLDNVLGLYKAAFVEKNIRVLRRYRCHGIVRGYPGELRQVFANLIGNALDAMARHATLTVSVSQLQGRVRITVADTGAGVAIEHLERIFEPFFTTKGEKGTGLGLWISHQIVGKHRGSLRVRSRTAPGSSGTVFCIFLPLAPVEVAAIA